MVALLNFYLGLQFSDQLVWRCFCYIRIKGHVVDVTLDVGTKRGFRWRRTRRRSLKVFWRAKRIAGKFHRLRGLWTTAKGLVPEDVELSVSVTRQEAC